MHELPVTESILEISLRHAEKVNAKKITTMQVVIGDLASIVDDSVSFYWDIISQGTIAENAKLEFERRPARLKCQDCGTEYPPTMDDLSCPACESVNVRVIQGEEFYLASIEVET